MKLKTLVKLLVVFISDKGWWREFIDEVERQGYHEDDVNLLIEK